MSRVKLYEQRGLCTQYSRELVSLAMREIKRGVRIKFISKDMNVRTDVLWRQTN